MGVVCKPRVAAKFGNDADVVIKREVNDAFGNDASVVSKREASVAFGNDAMFVRVRRRKIKGGHPDWREYRRRTGNLAEASASFDVVKAVRINGQPRQKFLCGLGSLKDEQHSDWKLCHFWHRALCRMVLAGFDADQRLRVMEMAARKSVPLPGPESVEKFAERQESHDGMFSGVKTIPDLVAFLKGGAS